MAANTAQVVKMDRKGSKEAFVVDGIPAGQRYVTGKLPARNLINIDCCAIQAFAEVRNLGISSVLQCIVPIPH